MRTRIDDVVLFGRLASTSVRGQMQYRASFLLLIAGTFLVSVLEWGAVWILFERFGHLRGWSLAEVALLYGLVNTAFAVSEATGRGFENVHSHILSGSFDRLLLRPRGTVVQLLGHELQVRRFGRLAQGVLVLLWAWQDLGLGLDPAKLALAALALAGASALFVALSMIGGMLSFWSTETLEIVNVVTHGGTFVGQYPISIYRDGLRRFFTWVVPLACVIYFPALVLLDRVPLGAVGHWIAPLAGFVFLGVSLRLWARAVRHYRSTGS